MPLTYLRVLGWGVWLYRRQAPLTGLTGFANWAALGAVLPPVITLGVAAPDLLTPAPRRHRRLSPDRDSKPDIYYIVFDRYGDREDDGRLWLPERHRATI